MKFIFFTNKLTLESILENGIQVDNGYRGEGILIYPDQEIKFLPDHESKFISNASIYEKWESVALRFNQNKKSVCVKVELTNKHWPMEVFIDIRCKIAKEFGDLLDKNDLPGVKYSTGDKLSEVVKRIESQRYTLEGSFIVNSENDLRQLIEIFENSGGRVGGSNSFDCMVNCDIPADSIDGSINQVFKNKKKQNKIDYLKYKEEIIIELMDLAYDEENSIALTPIENNVKRIVIEDSEGHPEKGIKLDLSKFKNLEEFSFTPNDNWYIFNISLDLNGLTKLKTLNCRYSNSCQFYNLDKVTSLETLALLEIYQIEKLLNITNVKKLHIEMCDDVIGQFSHFNNLEELYCCEFRSLKHIKHPEKIKKLTIRSAYKRQSSLGYQTYPITNTNGLEKFINLEYLDLSKNKITKIENFNNLNKLKYLNLKNNLIVKIENLDSLSNLKELDLTKNEIRQMEGLKNLKNLEKLKMTLVGSYDIKELESNKKLINSRIKIIK